MLYGTISHGTLDPQDLIPAFLEALEPLDIVRAAAIRAQVPVGTGPYDLDWWYSEECQWVLEDLTTALEESAPEGHYFGTLEGDGSDFGFWPLDSLS